jgi:hypothetical protein
MLNFQIYFVVISHLKNNFYGVRVYVHYLYINRQIYAEITLLSEEPGGS